MQIKQLIHKTTRATSVLFQQQSLFVGTGVLFGLSLFIWMSQFAIMFGSSLPQLTGLFFGIAIVFEMSWSSPRQTRIIPFVLPPFATWLIIAGWVIAFPWLLSCEASFIGVFPLESLSSMLVQTCIALIFALLIFIVPVFSITQYICLHCDTNSDKPVSPLLLAGMGLGLLVGSIALAPLWGLQTSGIVIATIATVCGIISFTKPVFFFKLISFSKEGSISNRPTAIASHPKQTVAVLMLGIMFALLLRVVSQLFVGTVIVVTFYWAILLLGVALGSWLGVRFVKRFHSQFHSVALPILLTFAWTVIVLFLFPQFVGLIIEMKVSIAAVWLQQVALFAVLLIILLPIGFVWGILSIQTTLLKEDDTVITAYTPRLLSFVTGFLLASWGIVDSRNVAGWLIVVSLLSLLFPVWHFVSAIIKKDVQGKKETRIYSRWQFVVPILLCCLVLSGPFVVSRYSPSQSSRLLYGINLAHARQIKFDFKLLASTDEAQLVEQVEGEQGTYTVWQRRGGQIQFRKNGIPIESVSTNLQVCPAPSTSVMKVLLPWVLHENPQSVLLLGLKGGTAVQTSLALPVEKVICIEEEQTLQKLVHQNIWKKSANNPLQDERFQLLSISPVIAANSRRQKFDIIVSSLNQTSLLQSASCMTKEYYDNLACQLTEEGIFCQPFERRDYGPLPILSLLKTMQLVFDEVMVVETATNEMLLLGTRSPKGLKRSHLVKRLQNLQARELLSQLGWDWSLPLNLRTFDDDAIVQLLNEKEVPANSVVNGRLAFQLPNEMMRWTKKVSKANEFEKLITSHAGTLLKWTVGEDDERGVLDRLAEVAGANKLKANYPDEWWMYRDEVKKQIQQNPRPIIQLVKGEGLKRRMHPDLQRRLNYFKKLGKVKAKKNPTLNNLAEIARFGYPYDPLMSYFMYQELVDIMPRVEGLDPHIELTHRQHSTYYGHSADRSIRNIIKTIKLIIAHPQLLDNRTTQIELDGLLQLLKNRWELRGAYPPLAEGITLNDINNTLTATELVFTEIERLQKKTQTTQKPTTGLQHFLTNLCDGGDPVQLAQQPTALQLRKAYITRTMVRPLRTYRSRLLSQHSTKQRKKRPKQK